MDRDFGKYKIKEVLGKGASGTVYRAIDSFAETEVALKIIDPNVFQDPENGDILRKQFLQEAALAGRLRHPHIVSILDAVVTEEAGHIVMDYVPGCTLSQHAAANSPLSIEEAVQISFKCCGALDYAFREGVIHRDIKPANILVTNDGDVKIADFGAAFLHFHDVTQTVNIGSPAYMSPEQISGESLTHSTDMYCLGVVLYELLTAQRPFGGDNVSELINNILQSDPAPPSQLRPGVPAELDRIVLTMLKKSPQDRYANWADLALDLAPVGRLSAHQQSIPDSEKYAALKSVGILAELSDAQLWELIRAGDWRRLHANTAILREGELGQSMFFLAKGEVKVVMSERLLNVIRAGECFGEMAYIAGGGLPRLATVESMTEVVLAEFQDEALDKMSDSCQRSFMRALMRSLVDRLTLADTRIVQLGV